MAKSRRWLKVLAAVAVTLSLTLTSVVTSASTASAASKKSPKMYVTSAFPTVIKEDGTLLRPTKTKNHWYIDVWSSSNKLTVHLNKKAKGKVCMYSSAFGSGYSKDLCKKVKKGKVYFYSDPSTDVADLFDDSDSILCEVGEPWYDEFGCAADLDLQTTEYLEPRFKLVFFPSNKKFKKQTIYVGSSLCAHLTLWKDFRPTE